MSNSVCEAEVRLIVQEELNELAKSLEGSVESGVTAALLSLGINSAGADQTLEVQRDMAFVRRLREGNEAMKSKTFMVVVGSIVTLAITFIGMGLSAFLGGQS